MTIILTDNEENIIAWSRTLWTTPGEYSNPLFRVVLCDLLPTERPKAIITYGQPTSKTFYTHEGPIICTRTYESATVETEPLPVEGEGE